MKWTSTGTRILYIHSDSQHSVESPNQWTVEPTLLVELVLKVNESRQKR